MTDWTHPQVVSRFNAIFPGEVSHLMPPWEEIPQEFKRYRGTPWNEWQGQWFSKGLSERPKAKPGIDGDTAMRHLHTIQGSWQPKHEHKEAAVAYLASLWFEPLAAAKGQAV